MENYQEYQLSYEEFKKYAEMNKNHLQQYLFENLIPRPEAQKITDQSDNAFGQSVKTGVLLPFFFTEMNGRRQHILFLKEDLERYAKRKRKINLPPERLDKTAENPEEE
ncbi:hypothetical protein [Enterococcus cecorum]|uniref:hypothetical protein n=1 Tax=Enterococcus cecorum TaxID=44008 RepID=UPI001FAD9360|nr:hypothetical protein [Enterococcus cecorum]MCJ0602366.1 hypothetical protein [Enterococcus cecorum]